MIIVDIDGVVVDNRDCKSFKEWEDKFETMPPNDALIELLTPNLNRVAFVTARNTRYRERTLAWFQIHWPLAIEKGFGFWFRSALDYRPSPVVKSHLLDGMAVAGYPPPTLAIDDQDVNIEMFRARGIPTMQHLMPGASGRPHIEQTIDTEDEASATLWAAKGAYDD